MNENWPSRFGQQVTYIASPQRDKTPQTSVLDMTLNNLMMRLQWCWRFGKCRAPLHCQCSQVHSDFHMIESLLGWFMFTNHISNTYIYKPDLALNHLQLSICQITKPNETKRIHTFLIRLVWKMCKIRGKWPYNCYFVGWCFYDLLKTARSILK